MTAFDDLVHRNEVYSKTASSIPYTVDLPPGGIPTILIYTCLDFRLEPSDFLQVKTGEAFIVRNAGGSVANNFTEFFFIDKYLQNQLKEIIVIHHDDCGIQHETEDGIKTDLKEKFPEHSASIDKLQFDMHDPHSVENSVKKDVKFLKDCPFIRKDIAIRGFAFDLKTNKLVEVK